MWQYDMYQRARKQGASHYIALQFEAYTETVATLREEGKRPGAALSCKAYLAGIDYQSPATVIRNAHRIMHSAIVEHMNARHYTHI